MRPAVVAVFLAALSVAGCSQQADDPATQGTPTAGGPTTAATTPDPGEPTEEPTNEDVLEITISGADVSPNGQRIDARVGEPVRLRVISDRAGELHVHATPEQTLPFDAGTTELELLLETPGIVDVEEHEANTVVLQVEVR